MGSLSIRPCGLVLSKTLRYRGRAGIDAAIAKGATVKPLYWVLIVDGELLPRRYPQRAAARGAAIILRAQGREVSIQAVMRE